MQRESSPLALILIDVDHFKACNDRLVHQAGDECLLTGRPGRPGAVARQGQWA